MLIIFINVIFVLTAIAMTVLILLQRGAGAAAGSGFGGGASATVFGARGSANFLSKATKWLAVVFFSISLGLAIYSSKPHNAVAPADDLGVMGQAPTAVSVSVKPSSSGTTATPAVPAPVGPAPAIPAPAQNAPVNSVPSIPEPAPAAPASNAGDPAKPGNKGG